MKITIDTSCLAICPNSGLSEVVRNLISELPLVEDGNHFNYFYNYLRSERKVPKHSPKNTVNQTLRVPRKFVDWLWRFNWFPNDFILPKADIYHSLHVQVPPSIQMKKILTVHDCRFLALPEIYSEREVKNYFSLMNLSLKRADLVVAVSKHTRLELLKYFTISENRIKVIHNGFRPYHSAENREQKEIENFTKKNRLPKDYLLFIGVLDPRKNLEGLIKALLKLKKERNDCPDLVIAGISQKDWCKSNQYKKAVELNLLKHIHITGVLEKDILWGITENAFALCYPSVYEGFGFPPLEAMSQGVPVLAGNNSSIPEITGNAACLVNALNVDDIADGLLKIIYKNDYRQKLIKRGFEQIKKFSWPQTAAKYIQLYDEVLG
jgi:glycosyltransferase involved in cell wall biosynthesis